jgi:recombination protein RecR
MTPSYSPMLDTLIDALRCLPGVGPRSAQRMAFHLLEERYKDGGFKLANILKDALQAIGELEYIDGNTLLHALKAREAV